MHTQLIFVQFQIISHVYVYKNFEIGVVKIEP